jgi:hypothetical protein
MDALRGAGNRSRRLAKLTADLAAAAAQAGSVGERRSCLRWVVRSPSPSLSSVVSAVTYRVQLSGADGSL